MALNEIAKHFYEKEVDRLLDLDDRDIIKNKFLDMRSQIDDLYVELGERARRIAELESKLEHSREYTKALRGMLGLRSAKENIELANKLYGLNFEVPDDEEPLPFSSDEFEEGLEEELEDLQERHQQDCITINQLHTTIDTLVDRYAKLREMRGL